MLAAPGKHNLHPSKKPSHIYVMDSPFLPGIFPGTDFGEQAETLCCKGFQRLAAPCFLHPFMRLCRLLLTAIFASQVKTNSHTKNHKTMRGKYINANIMMAALAGKRWRRLNRLNGTKEISGVKETAEIKETPASFDDYKIIWQKPVRSEKQKPLYRCITACIY